MPYCLYHPPQCDETFRLVFSFGETSVLSLQLVKLVSSGVRSQREIKSGTFTGRRLNCCLLMEDVLDVVLIK